MYLYRPPRLYAAIATVAFETENSRFYPDTWVSSHIAAEHPKLKEHFLIFRPLFRQRNFAEWYDEATNCMSYVIGDRTLIGQRVSGSSNLGALSGNEVKRRFLTPNTVMDMVEKEGMTLMGNALDLGQGDIAALYLDERYDYHWVKVHTAVSKERHTPRFFLSHKRRKHRPSLVTMKGEPIWDPHKISFKRGSYEVIPNPRQRILKRCYNFLSYVKIPNKLRICDRVIAKRKTYIEKHLPKKTLDWTRFIQRLADPETGGVLVPQCRGDETNHARRASPAHVHRSDQ